MHLAPVLVVLFLVVPLIELLVIFQVGSVIGGWPTFALLVVESLVGAYFVKREGRRAWRALRGALRNGRVPGKELLDSALVLIGGTLLLTPGFVTDALGFVLVLPLTRPVMRRILTAVLVKRFGPAGLLFGMWGSGEAPDRRRGPTVDYRNHHGGRVVESEVVPDEPAEQPSGVDRRPEELPPRS